jgi:hypothetical protein
LISINNIEDSLNESRVNFYFIDYITTKQNLTTHKEFMIKRLFNVNDNCQNLSQDASLLNVIYIDNAHSV